MKSCPMCAESIQDEAIKCRFCGEILPATPVQTASTSTFLRKGAIFPAVFILLVFLGLGGFQLFKQNQASEKRAREEREFSARQAAITSERSLIQAQLDNFEKVSSASTVGFNYVQLGSYLQDCQGSLDKLEGMEFKYLATDRDRVAENLKEAMSVYVDVGAIWKQKIDSTHTVVCSDDVSFVDEIYQKHGFSHAEFQIDFNEYYSKAVSEMLSLAGTKVSAAKRIADEAGRDPEPASSSPDEHAPEVRPVQSKQDLLVFGSLVAGILSWGGCFVGYRRAIKNGTGREEASRSWLSRMIILSGVILMVFCASAALKDESHAQPTPSLSSTPHE